MRTENIHYTADGLEMNGHPAWDETASSARPGVLVFPEAFGLGGHAEGRAERIVSELGYVALACDLHGEGKVFADFGQVMPLLQPLRTEAAKVRENLPVAIVGGRLVALIPAILLQQRGAHVTVYERDAGPESRITGGTLDICRDTGQKASTKAGVLEAF